ncbi:NAD(P)H-binding protein [Nocardia sp. ET3-3]|uniref:NAD(P)H-binding protein n=1 Tax=Nocardia terrae TaxID=2675851 RepID=A0A7K1V2Z5_9NOCA|nr:NAD(P)H-binding protein [Nocardia terrae]MVU80877.1 NAD(P)H-binding protein [Nocardia terrae]
MNSTNHAAAQHNRQLRIAVLGGTGLIGTRIVAALSAAGHDASALSRSTGVDLFTGDGLADALTGIDVAIDATQAPTPDDTAADFFRATVGNLHAAAHKAGVRHLVLLSIVGVDRAPDLGYYRAKTVQEKLFEAGSIPYSIVRATQFFEYLDEIISWTTDNSIVRLPATRVQPIAATDAARFVAEVATGRPLDRTIDIAGPEAFGLDQLGRITLDAIGDHRTINPDPTAGPFALAPHNALTADPAARLATTRYRDWLATRATTTLPTHQAAPASDLSVDA